MLRALLWGSSAFRSLHRTGSGRAPSQKRSPASSTPGTWKQPELGPGAAARSVLPPELARQRMAFAGDLLALALSLHTCPCLSASAIPAAVKSPIGPTLAATGEVLTVGDQGLVQLTIEIAQNHRQERGQQCGRFFYRFKAADAAIIHSLYSHHTVSEPPITNEFVCLAYWSSWPCRCRSHRLRRRADLACRITAILVGVATAWQHGPMAG